MSSVGNQLIEASNCVGERVSEKLREFEGNRELECDGIFKELCFCILVANNSLSRTKGIWESIDDGFLRMTLSELSYELKKRGYRFYNRRAEFVVEARGKKKDIFELVGEKEAKDMREWLVANIRGLGWKEASHFLRNLGEKDMAILDRHVLRFLAAKDIIEEVKTLGKRKYMDVEDRLRKLALEAGMNLAELDLYMFYLQAGEVCEK